jgi:hypothetical protein
MLLKTNYTSNAIQLSKFAWKVDLSLFLQLVTILWHSSGGVQERASNCKGCHMIIFDQTVDFFSNLCYYAANISGLGSYLIQTGSYKRDLLSLSPTSNYFPFTMPQISPMKLLLAGRCLPSSRCILAIHEDSGGGEDCGIQSGYGQENTYAC